MPASMWPQSSLRPLRRPVLLGVSWLLCCRAGTALSARGRSRGLTQALHANLSPLPLSAPSPALLWGFQEHNSRHAPPSLLR